MPIIIDNFNKEDAITRIQVRGKVLTMQHNQLICRTVKMMDTLKQNLSKIGMEAELSYDRNEPDGGRKYHINPRESGVSQMYLVFKINIENFESIEKILLAIKDTQESFSYLTEKQKRTRYRSERFLSGRSHCTTQLISDIKYFIDKAEQAKQSYYHSEMCFWSPSPDTNELLPCSLLPLPTNYVSNNQLALWKDINKIPKIAVALLFIGLVNYVINKCRQRPHLEQNNQRRMQ